MLFSDFIKKDLRLTPIRPKAINFGMPKIRATALKYFGGTSDQFVPSAAKETIKKGSKGFKQKIAEILEKAIEVAKRTKGF